MNTWNKTTNWNTSLLKQNNRQWMGTEDNSPRSLAKEEALSTFSILTYSSQEWKLQIKKQCINKKSIKTNWSSSWESWGWWKPFTFPNAAAILGEAIWGSEELS